MNSVRCMLRARRSAAVKRAKHRTISYDMNIREWNVKGFFLNFKNGDSNYHTTLYAKVQGRVGPISNVHACTLTRSGVARLRPRKTANVKFWLNTSTQLDRQLFCVQHMLLHSVLQKWLLCALAKLPPHANTFL
jgi:hypothetical protein